MKKTTKAKRPTTIKKNDGRAKSPVQWSTAKTALFSLEQTATKSESKKEATTAFNNLLVLAVGFSSGYRVADLLELKFSDFAANMDALDISERKTTKQRSIKIFDETRRLVELCRVGLGKKETDYIFTNGRYRSPKPLTKAAFINRVKAAFKACGIEVGEVSAHTLRKTFALRYYELIKEANDGDSFRALIETAKQLNHATPDVTRRYIGIDNEIKTKVLEKFF